MSALTGVTGASTLWCIVLVFFAKDAFGDSVERPLLKILPEGAQRKPVGVSLILSCRPSVEDISLITNLEWRDRFQRKIEEKMDSNMYSELMDRDSLGLVIPYLTPEMAGEYYCFATYGNTNKLNASITINTIVPITWVDAPESQYPNKGTNAKIKCEVIADPSAQINWMLDGQEINSNDRYAIETNGLIIKNIQESDDGIYSCRAVVILTGELSTRNIRVEVHTPPAIQKMENIVEVLEGSESSISCKAIGKPPPTYDWIKENNRENLDEADRFSVDFHTGLLTLRKVEASDAGNFKCTAKNSAGTDEIDIKLVVIVKPKIEEFYNVTVPIKNDTKIMCRATGNPLPEITFKKVGTNSYFVLGSQKDNERIILEQSISDDKTSTIGTLTILNINRTDDGLYECVASNKGDKAYKNGHITVEFPPSFESTGLITKSFSWDQRPVNLTCIAESIPNATIEWRMPNDRPVEETSNIRIFGKGPVSHLNIIPRDNLYYSMYRCVAKNRLGEASLDLQLRLATPPASVMQALVTESTATSVTFSIVGPPEEVGLPLRAFLVQYKDVRENDWNRAKNKTWSVNSPYTVENLAPVTPYIFRFAALNDVGIGSWGSSISFSTPNRSPPEPPKVLRGALNEAGAIQSPYADHFEVRWKIPADNGEIIDQYHITFCPVFKVNGDWALESEENCIREELRAHENTAYEMNRLLPDTFYRITLRAHNKIGYSKPEEIYVKTAQGMDTPSLRHGEPVLSSAQIIGIVVAGVILMLAVVDLLLCCCRRQGVIATICYKKSKQHEEDEAKLGSDEKEPLKDNNDRILIDNSMMRNTSVEFDGRRVHAKTGEIIGKNSAV